MQLYFSDIFSEELSFSDGFGGNIEMLVTVMNNEPLVEAIEDRGFCSEMLKHALSEENDDAVCFFIGIFDSLAEETIPYRAEINQHSGKYKGFVKHFLAATAIRQLRLS